MPKAEPQVATAIINALRGRADDFKCDEHELKDTATGAVYWVCGGEFRLTSPAPLAFSWRDTRRLKSALAIWKSDCLLVTYENAKISGQSS